jgi:hypothetical protein
MMRTAWLIATGAIVLAACVYPVTTDEVRVARSATNLAPAERSLMYLSRKEDGYRIIEPEIADVDWSVWRANYSPPGAVAVAPGSHSFRGSSKFFAGCRFTLPMVAGHAYRPVTFDCRYYPDRDRTDVFRKCLADNPASACCAALHDTSPDASGAELVLPCDPPPQ